MRTKQSWEILALETNLKRILSKSFDLREGEYIRTFLMMAYIFFIISSNLILKPTVISLFLSEFGIEQLPIAFILVAIFAGAIITFYSYSLSVSSIKNIIIKTLILSNFSFILFWILIRIDFLNGWFLYLFYIWVAVFSILSASQFWIFANLIFNSREAKRLFGIIGAGAISGGIFGGYLTSLLAQSIGSENLIFISVFFLSLCIPIVNYLWKINVQPTNSKIKQKKITGIFDNHPIKLIKTSKHLTYLALIVGISVVVARLVEFQFSAVAAKEIVNEDELTSFFGFWFSNMNIISLLIQLFLTRRVVGVFGVGTSLFFLPAGIFIGTFAIFISPALWAAILIRISDGSLKQSINKSGMELLALPVPSEIKNQTKSYIDIFVDSIATGIGGVLLIILSSGFNISIRYISFGTLLLLAFWFSLIFKVRREYINSFKLKLANEKQNLSQSIDISNESVLGGIIKLLNHGTEKQILNTLKTIKEIQNDRLLPSLEKLINYPLVDIQLEALRNIYFYKSHNYNDQVKNLINDLNPDVREEAFHYLFEHDPQDSVEIMNKYIFHPDKEIANSALVSLAVEVKDNYFLKNKFNLEKLVENKIETFKNGERNDSIENEKITTARVISILNLSKYYDDFNNLLNDDSVKVVNAALCSIKNILLPEYLPILIEKLKEPLYANSAMDSIKSYGDLGLNAIKDFLVDSTYNKILLRNIIATVSSIGNNKSLDILFNIMEYGEDDLKKEIFKALYMLKKNYPFLNYDKKRILELLKSEINYERELMLGAYLQLQLEIEDDNYKHTGTSLIEARRNFIKVLNNRFDSGIENILFLLGVIYIPDDIEKISKGIRSSNEENKLYAIDFLDNLLDINLKRTLIPVFECKITGKFSVDILRQSNMKIPDEEDSLRNLLKLNDHKITLSAVRVIYISQFDQLYSKINDLIAKGDMELKKNIEKIKRELNIG